MVTNTQAENYSVFYQTKHIHDHQPSFTSFLCFKVIRHYKYFAFCVFVSILFIFYRIISV